MARNASAASFNVPTTSNGLEPADRLLCSENVRQPALTAQLTALPAKLDMATIDALWSLPIGWEAFPPRPDRHFALQGAGWLITAATAMFGAPFWFDLLQRTVQMRGTGATPAERRESSRASQ